MLVIYNILYYTIIIYNLCKKLMYSKKYIFYYLAFCTHKNSLSFCTIRVLQITFATLSQWDICKHSLVSPIICAGYREAIEGQWICGEFRGSNLSVLDSPAIANKLLENECPQIFFRLNVAKLPVNITRTFFFMYNNRNEINGTRGKYIFSAR